MTTATAARGLTLRWFAGMPAPDVVTVLVAQQPRLVLIEASALPDWAKFVTTAKASPATRRIPIVLLGESGDAVLNTVALAAGCDALVLTHAFLADPRAVIALHLRPDESAEIARQASLPLPALARKAIAQFNAGEFWEQHETFETVWRAESGPIRQLYQGILQIGVAYLQIQRKNYGGARKIFQRAWQYLNVMPDVAQGIDVAQLRCDARAAQDELERLGAEGVAAFPEALFKPVQLVRD